MILNIIIWLALGIIAGCSAALKLYQNNARQLPVLLVLGGIGAIVGGSFGQVVTAANQKPSGISIVVAVAGAMILIFFYENISPQNDK